MNAVFQIGIITPAHPPWRAFFIEKQDRREIESEAVPTYAFWI